MRQKPFYPSLLGLRPSLSKYEHQNLLRAEAEQSPPLISSHLKYSGFHLPSEILLPSAGALEAALSVHRHTLLGRTALSCVNSSPRSEAAVLLARRDSCRDSPVPAPKGLAAVLAHYSREDNVALDGQSKKPSASARGAAGTIAVK